MFVLISFLRHLTLVSCSIHLAMMRFYHLITNRHVFAVNCFFRILSSENSLHLARECQEEGTIEFKTLKTKKDGTRE